MAHILTLLDGNVSPRPGEAGVVLFLRSSESGYRGQASAVAPGGQVTRRLGSWVGTCPVAVSQAMYQWVTSAGWHQRQISVALNSQYRPDQILSGPQEIQPLDWNMDHIGVFDLMLASFGARPQPRPPVAQPEPASTPKAAPRDRLAPTAGQSSREAEIARILGAGVKMLRAGSDADTVYQTLADGLASYASADDDSDDDLGDDLGDDLDDDLDEDLEGEDLHEPEAVVPQRLRPLMPGEVPPGLTPEQQLQLAALGDDRAREKMVRTMQRSEQAIQRARQVAALREQHQEQAEGKVVPSQEGPVPAKRKSVKPALSPAEPPKAEPPKAEPPKAEPSPVEVGTIDINGVPCLSVEAVSQISGKSPATVRLWCRDGKLSGKAFQARLDGEKTDRWLIPVSALEINGFEAQA